MCGLATYGYKITRLLGTKSIKLSNSRGFCLELSTALVVIIAARYGAFEYLGLGGAAVHVCSTIHLCLAVQVSATMSECNLTDGCSLLDSLLDCAGLPVSTTHILIGAVTAVGLFEGFRGVNVSPIVCKWSNMKLRALRVQQRVQSELRIASNQRRNVYQVALTFPSCSGAWLAGPSGPCL